MSTVVTSSVEREFERLFREHYRLLYRTACSLLDNPADAEDVLQAVFLRLFRKGLPPDPNRNAKGYLYRAVVNLCLDTIRTRKRREAAGAECPKSRVETADSGAIEESHRRLAEAVAELDPQAVHILLLKYVHNYKDADIARVLGTSRGAIAMRLLRSRSRLKKLMRDLGEQ